MTKHNTTSSTDASDEAYFENYLRGDSPLSDLYQKTDCSEPSEALNQGIISAAKASAKVSREETSSTIHTKKSSSTHWWKQPYSLAASFAIFSLVGILAHNIWQAEQNAIEKELSPVPSIHKKQRAYSTPLADQITTGSDFQDKNSYSPQEEKNDSRKLLYKIKPAPVMQAAPNYMKRNQMGSLAEEISPAILEMESVDEHLQPTIQTADKFKKEFKGSTDLTEQALWLEKISLLIKNNKIDEAHELMLQFKIKYPDYIIDPVIFQRLPPY
jgi:hypothetical protein